MRPSLSLETDLAIRKPGYIKFREAVRVAH
jgi:hypothetical protein